MRDDLSHARLRGAKSAASSCDISRKRSRRSNSAERRASRREHVRHESTTVRRDIGDRHERRAASATSVTALIGEAQHGAAVAASTRAIFASGCASCPREGKMARQQTP